MQLFFESNSYDNVIRKYNYWSLELYTVHLRAMFAGAHIGLGI